MTDWTQAACATKDPTEWDQETEYAYHHCTACPLMAHCLQRALLPEEQGGTPYGMRGGWTGQQRKYFKRFGKNPRPINWKELKGPKKVQAGKHPGKRISEAENARRLRLYESGMTDKEIAVEAGTTETAIESWRRYRKLPINAFRRGPLTAEDEMHRLQAWEIGLSDSQAAELLKCSTHSYRMWRRRKNLKPNLNRQLAAS
jgi:hypothetical protein